MPYLVCSFTHIYCGAGATDYVVPRSPFRQFGQDLRVQCMEVSITDDTEIEETESFTLRLVQPSGSESTNVLISPQNLTVRILDDDCELHLKLVIICCIVLIFI